jgi:hypothetical protein
MTQSALTHEKNEKVLEFAAESWQAEKERVAKLAEKTAKLRALRLASADPLAEPKPIAPPRPHVRRAFTVIR